MSDLTKSVKSILYVGCATMILSLASAGTIWVFKNRNPWHMMFIIAVLIDVFFWSIIYLGPKKFDISARILPDDVKRVTQNTLIVFTLLMGWFALTNA